MDDFLDGLINVGGFLLLCVLGGFIGRGIAFFLVG